MSRRLGGICNREAAAADRGDPAHGLIHGGLPGLHIKVCGRGDIGVAQKPGNRCNIDPVFDGSCGKGMPLRYNYDKPEKSRISRVFGYLARFFILFQTEKSSREVVIS